MKPPKNRTVQSEAATVNAAPVLRVTISKTSDGARDYMQVTSGDGVSVNFVLLADKIEVEGIR